MTEYLRPATLEQALRARAEHPDFMVLCGGTDLLVAAGNKPEPAGIIDVFGLAPLKGVREREGGGISIGAATTYAEILGSEPARRELPALVQAAREIGALQIQARGTLGGNIATSSPVGDSLPVLLALDAVIEVASAAASRMVPYTEFCTGYRKTAMAADELIVAVHIPPRPAGLVQYWRKVGTRKAQSISKVMIAAAARLVEGRVAEVRIGLGAVADRPIRARAVEDAVRGMAPGPEAADAARAALATEITPIDDVRSTASYRLAVARNLVARFMVSLA
jgi:CO/xanthine dehydrogenase FAD-binding subunit